MRPFSVETIQRQCDGAILGPTQVSRVGKVAVGVPHAPHAWVRAIRYDVKQRCSCPVTMKGEADSALAPTEPVSPGDRRHGRTRREFGRFMRDINHCFAVGMWISTRLPTFTYGSPPGSFIQR